MAIKLDISKAYDKVSRVFFSFFPILSKLYFNMNIIIIIKNVVNDVTFFVLVNWALGSFFSSSQGLHQGDPLSLYLFIIMEEVLSRNLVSMANSGRTKEVKHVSLCPPQTIQWFVLIWNLLC